MTTTAKPSQPSAAAATIDAVDDGLRPIAAGERTFSGLDQTRLWFVFGVGLLVIQGGTFLDPLVGGGRAAWVTVLLGSVVGSGILAAVARLGCRTGLASAGLMARVFGTRFGRLPMTLNALQLIGWTTFEFVILRSAIRGIAAHATGLDLHAWLIGAAITLACGVALALLLAIPMPKLVHLVVGRYDLPAEFLALAWVTAVLVVQLIAQPAGVAPPPVPRPDFGAGLDLVIAMPVSWLPLVADYARHAHPGPHAVRTTVAATWGGYAAANVWAYGVGVLLMGAALPNADMAATLILLPGGIVALALMIVHEFSNLYGGAYSASVSGSSAYPGWTLRRWGLGIAAVCALLALLLPMQGLQPFLLLLSSIFVPLFGVILGRSVEGARAAGVPATAKPVDLVATLIWIAGIALYQALEHWAPRLGSTLPTLAATFAIALLTRRRRPAAAA